MIPVSIIVAATIKNGIGYKNKLPWPYLRADTQYFYKITTGTENPKKRNAVIMGRKTWESLPDKFRPLPDRFNIVISKTLDYKSESSNVNVVASFQKALDLCDDAKSGIEQIFVIGGAQIYKLAMSHLRCETIYLTRIHKEYEADTFLPSTGEHQYVYKSEYEQLMENGISYVHTILKRHIINTEELQYNQLIRTIFENGIKKEDRTRVGTISKTGNMLKFTLKDGRFPMLTTKQVFWKAVVLELLWMISGSTDSKVLDRQGVKIWNANTSKETLKRLAIEGYDVKDYEEGDLGPGYGFQWRHFGAKYVNCKTDYKDQGVDQLMNAVKEIKENSSSRRIVVSAWNPVDLKKVALPPCHLEYQFVVNNGELDCCMLQRSVDMGLGLPFNIASYALLTNMMAFVTGLKPGTLTLFLVDTHIYLNTVEQLKEQMYRVPSADIPTLKILPSAKGKCIDQFVFTDLQLIGYNPQAKLKMDMAV